MALTTYSELQTAIADRMNRSSDTAFIPDWITIAEKEIVRWARVDWLETETDLTPSGAFVTLPDDFNSLRSLYWAYSNYRVPLEQVSPDLIDKLSPSNETGFSGYFCIQGTQIQLRPAPSGGDDVTIRYYFKPEMLSDTNTSNEILVNAPDMLFYRALVEGYDHIRNHELAQKYLQQYEKIAEVIRKDSHNRTWGNHPLRIQTDSVYWC